MRIITPTLLLLLFVASFGWTRSISRSGRRSLGDPKPSNVTTRYRFRILSFLKRYLSYIFGNVKTEPDYYEQNDSELSIMTWNILAPIWVPQNLRETGLVDWNLLERDIRLRLVARKILKDRPDVVLLQEVQIGIYDEIKAILGEEYEAQPFAPHSPGHWKEFSQGPLVENGMATFFRKGKYEASFNEVFQTSDNGNIAHISMLRKAVHRKTNESTGTPIFIANVHFQSEFSVADSLLRVQQGNAVLRRLSNLTEDIRGKFPSSEPVVIIGGDLNSIEGAPAVTNLQSSGFTGAKKASGNNKTTIYFPSVVDISIIPPFEGLSIDDIYVPTADVDSGRVVIKSTSIPDVAKDPAFKEAPYVRRVVDMVIEDLLQGRIKTEQARRLLGKLQDSLQDGNEYDTSFNRALRLGSDHLPIFAVLEIRE